MRNLRIDEKHEFEQEKGAVINELKRDEDEPWDLEQKAILPLLFGKTAPYGHPVIGEREHVRAATAEIIKAHYDKWYHPNNASLVVVRRLRPRQGAGQDQGAVRPHPQGGAAGAQTAVEGEAEAAGPAGDGLEVRRAAHADRLEHRRQQRAPTTRP